MIFHIYKYYGYIYIVNNMISIVPLGSKSSNIFSSTRIPRLPNILSAFNKGCFAILRFGLIILAFAASLVALASPSLSPSPSSRFAPDTSLLSFSQAPSSMSLGFSSFQIMRKVDIKSNNILRLSLEKEKFLEHDCYSIYLPSNKSSIFCSSTSILLFICVDQILRIRIR